MKTVDHSFEVHREKYGNLMTCLGHNEYTYLYNKTVWLAGTSYLS